MPSTRKVMCVALPVILLAACSKKDSSAIAAATPAPAAAESPPPKEPMTACRMVTAAEMSQILGVEVTAEPHEGTADQTECIYKPTKGLSPYVDFTVVRGDGESAMMAAGFMSQKVKGIADPYEGIGDQAYALGPALMIRTGEDLVKLIMSGVSDLPPKAKAIFDTAKPRM